MPKPNPQKPQDGTKKASLEDKLRKVAGDATTDAIMECDAAELRERLSLLAAHEKETEDKKEEDEGLINLANELKEAKAPYSDVLKSIALQRKFIALRMSEMGK